MPTSVLACVLALLLLSRKQGIGEVVNGRCKAPHLNNTCLVIVYKWQFAVWWTCPAPRRLRRSSNRCYCEAHERPCQWSFTTPKPLRFI